MNLTLSYNGNNDGVIFSPTLLLMLATEAKKRGISVELIHDEEEYDYLGVPAVSMFRPEYLELKEVIEAISGHPIKFEDLYVDYSLCPPSEIYGVTTAIGCVHHCKFCPQKNMEYIERPMETVIKELKYITDRNDYFEFLDNNVMANKERFFEIVKHIPEGVTWGALMNIENYSVADLAKLKSKGLKNIYIGLESFNPSDLEYFGKPYYKRGIDPKHFLNVLRVIGFNVHVFTIRALPNETEESFDDMLDWLKRRKISYSITRFYLAGQPVLETTHLSRDYLEAKWDKDIEQTISNIRKFILNK